MADEKKEIRMRENIFFENNPSDPNLPHDNSLSGKSYKGMVFKGDVILTKKILEKIVSSSTPTSKEWSDTDKRIICTTIPCPCCSIMMLVKVAVWGTPYHNKKDTTEIDGLYAIHVSPKDKTIHISVDKLSSKQIMQKEL
jgi:hypothetical protein